MFAEWTTAVVNGRMANKPPYPYVVVGKKSKAVTTAGGGQAYTHLLLQLWSFVPTVIIVAILLALTVWTVSTGGLGFHAGWLVVITCLLLILIPIALSFSEVSPWLSQEPTTR